MNVRLTQMPWSNIIYITLARLTLLCPRKAVRKSGIGNGTCRGRKGPCVEV